MWGRLGLLLVMGVFGCAELYQEPSDVIEFAEEKTGAGADGLETVEEYADRAFNTSGAARLDSQLAAVLACGHQSDLVDIDGHPSIIMAPGVHRPLHGAVVAGIERASDRIGERIEIHSGWRSMVQQYILLRLYERGVDGVYGPAPVGRSQHQQGFAIDVPSAKALDYLEALRDEGFVWYCDQPWSQRSGCTSDRVSCCKDVPHFTLVPDGHEVGTPAREEDVKSVVRGFQLLWNFNAPPGATPLVVDGVYGGATKAALKGSPVAGFDRVPGCEELAMMTEEAEREPAPSGPSGLCEESAFPDTDQAKSCTPQEGGTFRCGCNPRTGDPMSQACVMGHWVTLTVSPSDCGRCVGRDSSGCLEEAETHVVPPVCRGSAHPATSAPAYCDWQDGIRYRCACDASRRGATVAQTCRGGQWQHFADDPRDCGRCRGASSGGCRPDVPPVADPEPPVGSGHEDSPERRREPAPSEPEAEPAPAPESDPGGREDAGGQRNDPAGFLGSPCVDDGQCSGISLRSGQPVFCAYRPGGQGAMGVCTTLCDRFCEDPPDADAGQFVTFCIAATHFAGAPGRGTGMCVARASAQGNGNCSQLTGLEVEMAGRFGDNETLRAVCLPER